MGGKGECVCADIELDVAEGWDGMGAGGRMRGERQGKGRAGQEPTRMEWNGTKNRGNGGGACYF